LTKSHKAFSSGINLGSWSLLIYTLLTHCDLTSEAWKLIVLGVVLVAAVWLMYNPKPKKDENKK